MKAIELFAGAGGLGLGVSGAGFKPLAVVEWDQYCCDTIRENKANHFPLLKKWPLTQGDVRAFDFSPFADKLDLVSGGPPCQPFSIGGKSRGFLDVRDMFPQAVRAVRETRPRAFIFENVKGLTRESFSSYFEYVRLQLTYPEVVIKENEGWLDHMARLEKHHTHGHEKGLSYRLLTRVLNAADYGVPQKRERVFFVGFRSDLDLEWSFPEPSHSHDALLWDQWRSGEYWDRHSVSKHARARDDRGQSRADRLQQKPRLKPWATVRDAICDLPDPMKFPHANIPNHRFQDGARQYPGHTGSPLDEPAKTLKAGDHGVPGGENMLLRPNGTVRYFTVRESARLQTFPDDFVFHGSWTETMRQLGNAVPVKLAKQVAASVRAKLEEA
jgi:DNA (cytosine-5)-methyltransferase 1